MKHQSRDPERAERRYARRMRHEPTPAEKALWTMLRGSALSGWKFRRQHPVGHFILDFDCAKLKLAIELDGEGHMDQGGKAGDDIRTGELQRLGITVIRFENAVVVEGGELVLRRILQEIDSLQRCSKV